MEAMLIIHDGKKWVRSDVVVGMLYRTLKFRYCEEAKKFVKLVNNVKTKCERLLRFTQNM